jgi:hypothetical protein
MPLRPCTGQAARMALAGLMVTTLLACGRGEPTTDAERLARGRTLIDQMSARLAAASELTVTTTEMRDLVHRSGTKERLTLSGSYALRRPDRFHTRVDGGGAVESWYDGKQVTIALHREKVFAQAPMPETLDRTLDALAERYDMALPLADMFYSSPAKALLSDATTGGYAGTENVGSTQCHHLVFHDLGVDWEIWLPVTGDPLPARFKTVSKQRKGQPVTDVTFSAWRLAPATDATTFTPNIPADYEGIAILQRAAAVKAAAATSSPDADPVKK